MRYNCIFLNLYLIL